MTKITDNASLRKYVDNASKKNKIYKEDVAMKIAKITRRKLSTVQGWLLKTNPQHLCEWHIEAIQEAIDRGDL